MLHCLARFTSIGDEAIMVCPKPMAAAPMPLWFLSSTGPRIRFLPWHSSAIFLSTSSSFSTLAVPQMISGTSMASRTFLTVAAASSAPASLPLGSVLLSCNTIILAPNSSTHFFAHAAGSEITSLKWLNAASGHSSGSRSSGRAVSGRPSVRSAAASASSPATTPFTSPLSP